MNGSSHEGARSGQKPDASGQTGPSTPPEPALWHKPARDETGYDPSTGECALCWRVGQPHVECEARFRIWDLFDRLKAHILKERARPGAVVCKDCCIARLDGHKCKWWDLCWNI